jgi:roadblock/LC7 domain-containing protein
MHDPCFDGSERKDEQLRIVGQCHACTVASLVAQPCAVKLMRIKIKKSLLTSTRSYQWTDKMVYILAANKYLKSNNGRSRVNIIAESGRSDDSRSTLNVKGTYQGAV